MRLRFIVDVDVDPVSDAISNEIRNEIQSNLESLDDHEEVALTVLRVFEDTTVAPLRESSQAAEFDQMETDYDSERSSHVSSTASGHLRHLAI